MAVKDKTDDDLLDWNVETEVQLFQAMRGHKPVGVNRYFQMACIHEKFSNSLNKEITSQVIWDKLDTMYDMAALHESEIVPFPNEETDFALPDLDFGILIHEKRGNDTTEISPPSTKTTVKSETKIIKTETPEIKSKTGKESYGNKGKTMELLNPSKSVKSEALGITKTPKVESISSSSVKSHVAKTELGASRISQVAKVIHKDSVTPSKNAKQESVSVKSSKDNSSLRSAKVDSTTSKKAEITTPKSHKSDSQQNSKTQVKEKGSALRDKSESSSTKGNKELSRSSRESSKSRNNNDSSSDDMPLSSVTKSKKQEETSSKRKRPSRNTDTKGSSPNISSMSKRRRN